MSDLFFLFLHIATATVLVGGTVASRFALRSLLGAPDLASLRGALDVVQRVTRFNPLFAIAMLISGAILGRGGWWTDAWFWVAVATWAANTVLAVRVVVPGHQALGEAAARAGDGPVPAAVDALRHAKRPALALDAMVGLDLGTLLLMVVKPDAETALLWPLLGVALMWAIRIAGNAPRGGRTDIAAARR